MLGRDNYVAFDTKLGETSRVTYKILGMHVLFSSFETKFWNGDVWEAIVNWPPSVDPNFYREIKAKKFEIGQYESRTFS